MAAIVSLALAGWGSAAGAADAQQTGTKGTKPRTYDDEALKKYRGKGNITTSAKPAAAPKTAPGAPAGEEDLFVSGLGTDGQAVRSAYYAARKDAQASAEELNRLSARWAELHKRLHEAKSARERARIRKELETVQTAMAGVMQKGQVADDRMQNAMAQADRSGILRPPPPSVKVEMATKAPADPGR
jgi:hypothetical protein